MPMIRAHVIPARSTCGKKYKTSTGLKNHSANHKLEGALLRLPSAVEVRDFVKKAAIDIAMGIMFVPCGDDDTGNNFIKFSSDIAEKLSPASDDFVEFSTSVATAVEGIPDAIRISRKLLRSSIMTVVMTTLHSSVADAAKRDLWKAALCNVVGKPVDFGIAELYLQEFVRQLNHSVVKFIVQCMRTSVQDLHATNVQKRTPEAYDMLFKRQTLHHVLGAAVRSLLKRCRQYPNNARYQKFKTVILQHITVSDTGVSNPQSSTFWTSLINRKSLLFLSEKTVVFFCEVAKIICYAETLNGCLYREDILNTVFSSPSLLSQWEDVVGGSMSEDLCFDLLRMFIVSLLGTFGKGILLRRINEAADNKTAQPVSVGIRAKVTR